MRSTASVSVILAIMMMSTGVLALAGQAAGQDPTDVMWSNARGDNGRSACMAVDGLERNPEAMAEFVMTSAAPNAVGGIMPSSMMVQPDGRLITSLYLGDKSAVVGFEGSNVSTLIEDATAVGLDVDGSIIYIDISQGDPVLRSTGNPQLALYMEDRLISDVLATETEYVMVTMDLEGQNMLWAVSHDGTVAWTRALDDGYVLSASPSIDDGGNIYLCMNSIQTQNGSDEHGSNSLYYIFRSNGELRFMEGLGDMYAYPVSPVIGSNGVPYVLLYTVSTMIIGGSTFQLPDVTSVVAIKDGGGRLYKFDFEFEEGYVLLSEPAVDANGLLYVIAQDIRVDLWEQGYVTDLAGSASLWAISAAGRYRWNRTLEGESGLFGPIVDAHGSIYAATNGAVEAFRWYGGQMFKYRLPGLSSGMVFGTDGDLWVTTIFTDQYGHPNMVMVTDLGEGEPWVYQNMVYVGLLIMVLPIMVAVVVAVRDQD